MDQPIGNMRNVQVLGIDAGGTMTDTFFVDVDGDFVVGKAQSTPDDESLGLVASSEDGLANWGISVERVDMMGKVVIPLREESAREAARDLIAADVEGIVISLLHSYKNPTHERRVRDIVAEEVKNSGKAIPIFASADHYPVRKETHRTNTTILEGYAAEPSRQTLRKISDAFKERGTKFDFRVMATHGGTISWKAKELARTIVSGPIGGLIGARYLGAELGYKNIACSDIGGTSFDVALITQGELTIRNDPDMARLVLSLPLVAMDSVGAGPGSFVRLDPYTKSIKLGPDSAGYRVGVCWKESGIETVSVSDCHMVLGYLNPDNLLGGAIKLDRQRLIDAIKVQVADPLGLSVEDAAAGVIELLDSSLRDYLRAMISGKGYSPASFVCFSYGGAGPVHAYGYTEGLSFEDVIVPAWAAGFSAFGCAAADFECRYDKSLDINLPDGAPDADKAAAAVTLQEAWEELTKERARGVQAQRLQPGPGDVAARLPHAVPRPAERPRDRLAAEADQHDGRLESARASLRRHVRPGLCRRGALAGTGLLRHRRHHARRGADPEAEDSQGGQGRCDAAAGCVPRHAQVLPQEALGGRQALPDGVAVARQPRDRSCDHRIGRDHLRGAGRVRDLPRRAPPVPPARSLSAATTIKGSAPWTKLCVTSASTPRRWGSCVAASGSRSTATASWKPPSGPNTMPG